MTSVEPHARGWRGSTCTLAVLADGKPIFVDSVRLESSASRMSFVKRLVYGHAAL